MDPGLGLGARLEVSRSHLASMVADLDPARLTGAEATGLYRCVVDVERLANAAKTLLAPRIEESGVWREGGHRSPAVMLASLEGVAPGQAQSTLSNGQRLGQLPGTEAALRTGVLSGPKVTELTGAGVLAPEREAELLSGAGEAPLQDVRDRCRRSRATSAAARPPGRGQADPQGAALLVVDRRGGGLLLPGPGHRRPGGPDPLPPRPGGHQPAPGPEGGR